MPYIFLGFVLYGVYWLMIHYWPFILTGALVLYAGKKAANARLRYKTLLDNHQKREHAQNELFLRFSDKPIIMRSFHPVYFLFVMIGCVVAAYAVNEAHAFADHEGWIRAIPRDYRNAHYVIWAALFCLITISVFRIIMALWARRCHEVPKLRLRSAKRAHVYFT